MKLLKPHHLYPDIMSKEIRLIRTHHIQLTLEEKYEPHFIYVNIWLKRGKSDMLFTLIHSIHIPLSKYSRLIHKCIKYENKYNKMLNKLRRYNNE